MKEYFLFLIKYLLFWILYFFLQRIIFLTACHTTLSGTGFSEILNSFFNGFTYDLSAACYLTLIPLLLISVHSFGTLRQVKKIIFSLSVFFLIITAIIGSADIGMFQAWGTKLNHRAISYLMYPAEALKTVSTAPDVLPLLILILFQIFIGVYFVKKTIPFQIQFRKKVLIVPLFLATLFLFIVAIRGGFQTFPMNKGRAYYSKKPVLNLAAMNSSWSILYDLIHPSKDKNHYRFFPEEEARNIVDARYAHPNDSISKILTSTRPNIVIIHLESWSAEVIETLGGEKNITPFFNGLCKDGILFTNFYASGYRTEHGLISIHCGFPAQPSTSIIRDYGKFEKLPSFPLILDSLGYAMNAYYGGNLNFANSGPFFYTAGYKKVFGEDDFKYSGRTSWGAYDADLFKFAGEDLKNVKQPFLSYIMTITSHEPFDDVPGKHLFPQEDIATMYKNSVHYTDNCLEQFFTKAEKEPWYANTLFILVADHSSFFPNLRGFNHPGRFRIPFLLFGNVLKQEFRGTTIEKFASQFDVPSTLLPQMELSAEKFKWSKNLFQKSAPSFSYFTFEDGFGVMTDSAFVIFDNDSKRITNSSENEKSERVKGLTDFGKAMEELVQNEYLKLN